MRLVTDDQGLEQFVEQTTHQKKMTLMRHVVFNWFSLT